MLQQCASAIGFVADKPFAVTYGSAFAAGGYFSAGSDWRAGLELLADKAFLD
jgi:hypothetical protein